MQKDLKDTIRVEGPRRKTLSGKQHSNLQDVMKTLLLGGWPFDTGYRSSVVVVLIQARLRDNCAINK